MTDPNAYPWNAPDSAERRTVEAFLNLAAMHMQFGLRRGAPMGWESIAWLRGLLDYSGEKTDDAR